ncbi:MAG: hypothetical protein AAGA03_09005 [Planctomycetota bacterium]
MPRSSKSSGQRGSKTRGLRPWSKKRGERLLGHALGGLVGEAVFYLCLFLAGVFVLSLVLISRLAPEAAADVSAESVGGGLSAWVFGTLGVASISIGTGGLLYRLSRLGTSTEWRSAMVNRAGTLEIIGPSSDDVPKLPSVPQSTELSDSPGERLTYRLPAKKDRGVGLLGAATLAMIWNAVWFVLLAVSISGFWYGAPRWVLTGLLLPFAAIGIWVFRYLLAQLRQSAGVGPTIVEIDEHPLVPGQTYRIYVAQTGRLTLKRLNVHLLCEEESFYRQGTDVRVEKHVAFRELLFAEKNVRVDRRHPWEQQLSVALPQTAMHSFAGMHNAVRWSIVISGEARPWPSFCRSFPVIVHPQALPLRRSPR